MFLASKTDTGKKREENQDRVFTGLIDDDVSIAVVCDGMGGALSGGVASEVAITNVYNRIKNNFRRGANDNSIRNLLLTAVHSANTIVYEKSKEDIDKNGMGTTCVAALVVGKKCYIVNVGDSRAYLLTHDKIEQITTDHTYVQMLYEQGQISKEEIANHHMKNIITKAVGVEADVDVDYFELEPKGNFTLVLCSDGMSNYCNDDIIYDFVYDKNLDNAVDELIKYSNDKGGKDNISVAIIAN